MNLFRALLRLFNMQVLVVLLCAVSVNCCNYNFGPGNIGLFNYGVGNVGFFNFGVFNGGLGNKGLANFGIQNTGFAQLGLRNIGALNAIPVPSTISIFNVPVAPNLSPGIFGRRRRRRSTMNYPERKFPWLSSSNTNQKIETKDCVKCQNDK